MEELRVQLELINREILWLFFKRRKVIEAIIEKKSSLCPQGSLYDPERELKVFEKLRPFLKEMDLEELLSFSLLIEIHVRRKNSNYPCWSQGKHSRENSLGLVNQINPLLLKVVRPSLFKNLVFKEGFQ